MEVLVANPYGCLSESRLCRFETIFSVTLPEDYRSFLLDFNGPDTFPKDFEIPYYSNQARFGHWYGLHKGPHYRRLDVVTSQFESLIGPNVIPIGSDIGRALICVGVHEEYRGGIYVWDPDYFEGLIKIRSSFLEFTDSFYDEEADE